MGKGQRRVLVKFYGCSWWASPEYWGGLIGLRRFCLPRWRNYIETAYGTFDGQTKVAYWCRPEFNDCMCWNNERLQMSSLVTEAAMGTCWVVMFSCAGLTMNSCNAYIARETEAGDRRAGLPGRVARPGNPAGQPGCHFHTRFTRPDRTAGKETRQPDAKDIKSCWRH